MGDDAEKSAQDKIGESVGMIRIDEVLKPCEILTVVGVSWRWAYTSTFTSRRTMLLFHKGEEGC
jgi:hypothetical protein